MITKKYSQHLEKHFQTYENTKNIPEKYRKHIHLGSVPNYKYQKNTHHGSVANYKYRKNTHHGSVPNYKYSHPLV